jgi:hypothetical protein
MVVPLLILIWRTTGPGKRATAAAKLAGAGGVVALATFVPVLHRYGWTFLTFFEHPTAAGTVLERGSVALWGRLGTVAILLSLVWWAARIASRRARVRSSPERGTVFLVCITSIALYAIAFVRLPHLPGYLIPAVPFVLLLLATLLERPAFRIVCVAVALSSFLTVGRSGLSAGPILEDHSYRVEGVNYTRRVLELGRTLSRKTVIVAGHWLPKIEFYEPGGRTGPVQYVYLLDADALRSLQKQGFDVFFLPGQREFNLAAHGIDLLALGVRPLIPSSTGWHW